MHFQVHVWCLCSVDVSLTRLSKQPRTYLVGYWGIISQGYSFFSRCWWHGRCGRQVLRSCFHSPTVKKEINHPHSQNFPAYTWRSCCLQWLCSIPDIAATLVAQRLPQDIVSSYTCHSLKNDLCTAPKHWWSGFGSRLPLRAAAVLISCWTIRLLHWELQDKKACCGVFLLFHIGCKQLASASLW